MSDTSEDLIRKHVESVAESINALDAGEVRGVRPDSLGELEPLDVKAEINARGDLAGSITLVLSTGGPHVELDATRAEVNGWWGGATHTASVDRAVCEAVEDYYIDFFEDVVLA